MKNKDLITTLKVYAKRTGIRQEDLAKQIGVRLVTVNRWFNGHNTRIHLATENAIRSYLDREGILR